MDMEKIRELQKATTTILQAPEWNILGVLEIPRKDGGNFLVFPVERKLKDAATGQEITERLEFYEREVSDILLTGEVPAIRVYRSAIPSAAERAKKRVEMAKAKSG